MRAILFLLLVICTGAFAQAQENTIQPKVKTISMPLSKDVYQINLEQQKLPTVTGIFVRKNSRVKQALLFRTKKKEIILA